MSPTPRVPQPRPGQGAWGEWRWPQRLLCPGREQGAVVRPGRGVTGAVPLLARALPPARKHKPLSYVLPFVVARVWLVMAATA